MRCEGGSNPAGWVYDHVQSEAVPHDRGKCPEDELGTCSKADRSEKVAVDWPAVRLEIAPTVSVVGRLFGCRVRVRRPAERF